MRLIPCLVMRSNVKNEIPRSARDDRFGESISTNVTPSAARSLIPRLEVRCNVKKEIPCSALDVG